MTRPAHTPWDRTWGVPKWQDRWRLGTAYRLGWSRRVFDEHERDGYLRAPTYYCPSATLAEGYYGHGALSVWCPAWCWDLYHGLTWTGVLPEGADEWPATDALFAAVRGDVNLRAALIGFSALRCVRDGTPHTIGKARTLAAYRAELVAFATAQYEARYGALEC